MKRYKATLTVLAIILACTTVLGTTAENTVKQRNMDTKAQQSPTPGAEQYIIELRQPSIIERKHSLRQKPRSKIQTSMASYAEELAQTQEEILNEISGLSKSQATRQAKQFRTVYNGIATRLTRDDVRNLRQNPKVEHIHRDRQVQTLLDDSVPNIQGGIPSGKLSRTSEHCDETQSECLTGENITIGVIDTGVDYTHEAFNNCTTDQFTNGECRVKPGYDYANDDEDPMDDHGHGTHVAATAASNGTLPGVAPGATIYSYKVLNSNGYGRMSDVISAIEDAAANDVDVLSLSLGTKDGDPTSPVSKAANNAVQAGSVVVAAAGNFGPSSGTIASPAAAPRVITVGAQGGYKEPLADFSSRGPVRWENNGSNHSLAKPDIVAPGVEICAAQAANYMPGRTCDENHINLPGTSMATPHVSGSIALLLQQNSGLTPGQVKTAVTNNGDSIGTGYSVNEQGSGALSTNDLVQETNPPTVRLETTTLENGIRGELTGADNYTVSYKSRSDDWERLCAGNPPADVLCSNTDELPEGQIKLRLRAHKNNTAYDDITTITKDEIRLQSIGNDGYLTGQSEITGSMEYDQYNRHRIRIKANHTDGEWQTICNEPSQEPLRCTVNASQLDTGVYKVQLAVHDGSEWIQDEPETAVAMPLLHQGDWPITFPCDTIRPQDIVFDDGDHIALTASKACDTRYVENKLYAVSADGSTSAMGNGYVVGEDPALVDDKLGLAGYVEGEGSNVFLLNETDGILGEPLSLPFVTDGEPAVTNNTMFIQTIGTGRTPRMRSITPDGEPTPGSPEVVMNGSPDDTIKQSILDQATMITPSGPRHTILRKTRNFAGEVNITLERYHPNGTRVDNKKVWSHDRATGTSGSLVSADTNNDGSSELVASYKTIDEDEYDESRYSKEAYETKIERFSTDLQDVTTLRNGTGPDQGHMLGSLAMARIDDDPAIITLLTKTFATDSTELFILRPDGTTLTRTPLDVGSPYSPLVADMTNNGEPNILVPERPRFWEGEPSRINVYDVDGDQVKEYLLPTKNRAKLLQTVLVNDLDQDGDTELYVKADEIKQSQDETHSLLIGTNATHNDTTIHWPMQDKDSQHSNCYDCEELKQTTTSLIQNDRPQPVNANLTVTIQHRDQGWKPHITAVNTTVSIPARSTYDISQPFNQANTRINQTGTYRVQTELITPNHREKRSHEVTVT